MTQPTIEQVFQKVTREWMSLAGVLGAAIGRHEEDDCVYVYVVEKTEDLAGRIPEEVDGYAVRIEETGVFTPLALIGKQGDRKLKR